LGTTGAFENFRHIGPARSLETSDYFIRGRIDRINENSVCGGGSRQRLWSYGHLFAIVPDLAVATMPFTSRRKLLG
jgi:hypothetical protein